MYIIHNLLNNAQQILLTGPIGPKVKELLHPRITVANSSLQGHDEVHLIMEYQVDDTWGDSTATVATRFITSHDEANGKMVPLENFFVTIAEYDPDLIVLSGLHMLDGQSEDVVEERIAALLQELEAVPPQLPVHLELASMASSYLVKTIVEEVSRLLANYQR